MNAKHTNQHFKRNWPFYWISRADARYVQVLDKRLKPIGIDVPRWRVLMSLYEDTYLSISEIADFSTMRLNTTTKVVQRMIGDGLVTTRVRPTDARVTEACLTPEGDRLRALALKEARDIFEISFQNVSSDEMATLNEILEKVFSQLNRL
ncbi:MULTISPECIES: MarR family winged helix-turn-helix transcriptional regulator [Alphaproteobacteria]|uniref:MarR family transcriptional regulator n=2 Tax=Alphaproteobacteria TaxID=28211 RepID=A0A512HH20_9HYPH|nr:MULTISPECIES: MarR family winged helix-turn-helix transcriptional regulator [Alphaproteobacteria]GEO84753.1 MarR family transcriptional regulator [Ciceribacter naphthalenivorans]GLR20626.1 MarR family transcriptional regulator [Ciceribacter naphthalenivorans]GLT03482.1 MarR family transcriptional regulator [Sphingomonas psychrolutea]